MERKIGGRKTARKAKVGAKKRKTTHRRGIRGVGDIGGMVQKAGGLVVGAVAARELNTLAVKFFPTLTPMISGILQIGVGYMLPKFVKGAFFANMGDGMIANGGMVLVVSTGVITGAGDTMTYRVNGTSQLNVVGGGTSRLNVVSGPTNRVNNNPIPQIKARSFALRGA